MGEMYVEAMDHEGDSSRSQERTRKVSPFSPLEGSNLANTLISDFQPLELQGKKFLSLKTPSLWTLS